MLTAPYCRALLFYQHCNRCTLLICLWHTEGVTARFRSVCHDGNSLDGASSAQSDLCMATARRNPWCFGGPRGQQTLP